MSSSPSTAILPPNLQKPSSSPPTPDEDQVVWKAGTPTNASSSKRSTPAVATTPLDSAALKDASKWKMTNNGKIMDPTSGSSWEIADEILKLQINGGPPATEGRPQKDSAKQPSAEISVPSTATPTSFAQKSSNPSSPSHVVDDQTSAPRSRQSSGGTAVDDSSSSVGSSSLATPNLGKEDHSSVSKPALNGLTNGHQAQKDQYSPPASAGTGYTNGAYIVNGTSPNPASIHSPPPFPHHIQTSLHHGHIPPPQFSPHHMHLQQAGPPPPRGVASDMHHLAQAAHLHMHTQHFDPYRPGGATPRDDGGAVDYASIGREGLAISGLNGRNGLNGSVPNGAGGAGVPPSFASINTQDPSSNPTPYDPRTSYPASPPPQVYPGHPMSPTLSPTYAHLSHHYPPIPHHPYAAYGAGPPGTPGSIYELMSHPPHDDPRMVVAAALANRGQFRGPGMNISNGQSGPGGHQHSASDPTVLRDATAGLNALGGGMGDQGAAQSSAHAHSLSLSHTSPYSPQLPTSPYGAPMSPNPYQSFYGHMPPPQASSAAHQEVLNAMARLSPTTYAANPNAAYAAAAAAAALAGDPATLALMQNGAGPSANNRKLGLYKTELCRSWEEKGSCRYGSKCQFAHGEDEIRKVARHPKYKTEICRTFWVSGSCPYGKRCCFIHTELPSAGLPGAPGVVAIDGQRPGSTGAGGASGNAQGGNNSSGVDGRARSMSTNSDPNDAPSSLLARINAKAHANNAARANETSSPSNANGGGQYGSVTPTEVSAAVTAAAIAQAYAQYGRPAQAALAGASAIEKDLAGNAGTGSNTAGATNKNGSGAGTPVNNVAPTPSAPSAPNGLGHRVSASVDFSGHARHQTLGGELTGLELGGHVLGHHRNPSASSIVHGSYSITHLNSSRSTDQRLSGHSSPFTGDSSNVTPSRASPAPATGATRFMHERSHSGGIPRGSSYSLDRAWAL